MKKFAMDMLVSFLFLVLCVVVAGEEIVDVAKEYALLWLLWLVGGGLLLAWIGFCLHRSMNPPRPPKENTDDVE